MAVINNSDGSVTVTDDTGRLQPFTVPAAAVPTLMPQAAPPPAPLVWPPAAAPAPAPVPVPEPAPAPPQDLSLYAPTAMAPPPALSTDALAQNVPLAAKPNQNAQLPPSVHAQLNPPLPPPRIDVPATNTANWPSADSARGAVNPSTLATPTAGSGGPAGGGGPTAMTPPLGDAGAVSPEQLLRDKLVDELTYKPGGYTPPSPARNVLQGFRSEEGVKFSPGAKDDVQQAYDVAQLGLEAGAKEKKQADLQVALAHARAADIAQEELSGLREKQVDRERMLSSRMEVIDRHVARAQQLAAKDVVGEFFAEKGVMGRIAVALGAAGAALTGGPNTAYDMMKMELEARLGQQRARIEAGSNTAKDMLSAYGQMRSTFLSPEAAEDAARFLMTNALQNMVLESAAVAKSEEERLVRLELADKLGIDAAQYRMNVEEKESDKIVSTYKHVEAVRGGYSKPGRRTLLEALALAKAKGIPVEEAYKAFAGRGVPFEGKGGLSRGEVTRDESRIKRQVVFQDGSKLFAGQDSIARETQEYVASAEELIKGLRKLRPLTDNATGTMLPENEGKASAIVASNRLHLKPILKEALTVGELPNYAPLIGEGTLEWRTTGINARATIDQAVEELEARIAMKKKGLYTDPEANKPYAGEQKAPEGAKRAF